MRRLFSSGPISWGRHEMSSGRPNLHYGKPWLSIAGQLSLLEGRGLQISDKAQAQSFLGHVGYYRFAGYCLAFEQSRHRFMPGVTFENVQLAYWFDAKLRDLFTEILELLEVDLRTTVAYAYGKKYGAFGHTTPANFHQSFGSTNSRTSHNDWLSRLREEAKRSKDLFATHFRTNYREFPDLPIWVATELMSFGVLSLMISGLQKSDRKAIAQEYNLAHSVFSSLAHHLTYVRNLCAHHSRLWDRSWSVTTTLPNTAEWQPPLVPSNKRLFSTLLLLRFILKDKLHLKAEVDCWRDRVNQLLHLPSMVPQHLSKMGLTEEWQNHPYWQ